MKGCSYLKVLNWIAVVLLLITVAGCAHNRPQVHDISQVNAKEVIVVGRIELTPPLDKMDQNLHGIGSGQYKNKVYVVTDEKWRNKEGAIESGDEYFETLLDKPFYTKASNKPFYFLTQVIYTYVSSHGTKDCVNLPGGVKVDIHHDDKAVYIGTLRFTRNEYFDITNAQIIDDYKRANAAFKRIFKVKYNLRKALAIPIQSARSR